MWACSWLYVGLGPPRGLSREGRDCWESGTLALLCLPPLSWLRRLPDMDVTKAGLFGDPGNHELHFSTFRKLLFKADKWIHHHPTLANVLEDSQLLEIPMFTILTTGKNDPYFLQQPEFFHSNSVRVVGMMGKLFYTKFLILCRHEFKIYSLCFGFTF